MSKTSSTKQLKQVLGFWDLMGVALGQIIGTGVMTLLGAAMSMTGRSIPFAFFIAAVISIAQFLPLIFISGTVRLRGGNYTMVAMLAGKKFAGIYTIIYVFSNVSISMYALSFASYMISFFGLGNEKIIAFIILTLFFILNILGIDKFAKVQNLIVGMLLVALSLFIVFGVGKIGSGYFDEASFMTGGTMGLLQAGGLLTFAVGGGSVVINLSAEAKKPTRDLPLVMIVSTLLVAGLYGGISVVAAGVLPLEQVAGQNLSVVAEYIFSRPVYAFFMICGAGFALISTLNSQFAWSPKPVMQACDDGWLPGGLAKLSKWNTPYIIMTIVYGLGVVCIFTGLSVSILGNMTLISLGFLTLMVNAFLWKLPSICPEEWKESKFKIGKIPLGIITVLSSAACVFSIYLNISGLSMALIVLNLVVVIAAAGYAIIREKHVTMDISYEKA